MATKRRSTHTTRGTSTPSPSKATSVASVGSDIVSDVKTPRRLKAFGLLVRVFLICMSYILVVSTATAVLPYMAATLARLGGITKDSSPEVFVAVWMIPTMFVAGMIFYAEVLGLKAMWRWGTQQIEAAREWPIMKTKDQLTADE